MEINMSDRTIKTDFSKSGFMKGLQCHKYLYMYAYHHDLMDEISDAQESIFQSGTDAGILAQSLFPGGILVPFEGLTMTEQINQTQEAIRSGADTIYEATFSLDGVLVKADILHSNSDGWDLYEVKSTTSLKDDHIPDIAIQYYVISGSGFKLNHAYLVHINNQYVKDGDIDVQQLFTTVDVTDAIKDQQAFVVSQIPVLKKMLAGDMPSIDIGEQCGSPYTCSFKGYCWKAIPEDSIFSIGSAWIDKFAYYRRGIVKIADVPVDELSPLQLMLRKMFLAKGEVVNKEAIKAFLDSLWYPLYFFDFETISSAVPYFDGTRPYEQIPFQYSLHYLPKENGELGHYEYLAQPAIDPRRELTERLLQDIPDDACVLVWHQQFEIGRLKRMKEWFPQYVDKINNIIENIIDLKIPFSSKLFYNWKMSGSASLKYVYPALIDAGLQYEDMDINNGLLASETFWNLFQEHDEEKLQKTRQALLEYCELDTMAMVKILEKLYAKAE